MNKKIIIPSVITTTLVITSLLSIKIIYAQDTSSYSPIVQKLAERFNLQESEVQEVFDEAWEEREAQRYAQWREGLDEALAEGRITREQMQEMLEHHNRMQEKMQELRNLPWDERHDEMHKLHEEMNLWRRENGLQMHGRFMGGMHRS